MNIMEDQVLSFYEKVHYQELEDKDKLLTRIQISSALLITNGSAFIYMLRNLDFNSDDAFIHYFILFAAVNFVVIAVAAYFLMQAFSSSEYKSMPTLEVIDEYLSQLKNYSKQVEDYNAVASTPIDKVCVSDGFTEYLKKTYIECATFNSIANKRRSAFSYNGMIVSLSAFVPLFICSSLFIADDMDASSSRKPTDISAKNIERSLNKIYESIEHGNKDFKCLKIKQPHHPSRQSHPYHQFHHNPLSLKKVMCPQNPHLKKETNNG